MAKKVVEKKTKLTKKLAKKMEEMKVPTVKLASFSFGATIPTQAFGNITPSIEVIAERYEDARDFAVPKILEYYKYAEFRPAFLGKVTEKVVNVAAPKEAAESSPSSTEGSAQPISPTTAPSSKSEPVLKAEKAIGLAMSVEATEAIQSQIEKSTKIAAEDKPALYTLVLKKRKEFKK